MLVLLTALCIHWTYICLFQVSIESVILKQFSQGKQYLTLNSQNTSFQNVMGYLLDAHVTMRLSMKEKHKHLDYISAGSKHMQDHKRVITVHTGHCRHNVDPKILCWFLFKFLRLSMISKISSLIRCHNSKLLAMSKKILLVSKSWVNLSSQE